MGSKDHERPVLTSGTPPAPPGNPDRPSRPRARRASAFSSRIGPRAVIVLAVILVVVAGTTAVMLAGRSRPAAHIAASTPAGTVAASPAPATALVQTPAPPGSSATPETPAASEGSSEPSPSPSPSYPGGLLGWELPAGWSLEITCDDEGGNCQVHRVGPDRLDAPGWPVPIAGDCRDVVPGPADSAFAVCEDDRSVVVTGLGADGRTLAGWPVALKGAQGSVTWNEFDWGGLPSIAVGPDGTVHVAVDRRGVYQVHALGPGGEELPGWPVNLPGSSQGYRIAPDGSVLAWWYEGQRDAIGLEARRTVFTMIERDGRTRAGWPIGSKGAASGPVVWRDGSVYYVTAAGNAYGHDRDGRRTEGWPRSVGRVAPTFRSDGRLRFVSQDQVLVLDRGGKTVRGWPVEAAGLFSDHACDTPSWPHAVMDVTANGTLYLLDIAGTRDRVVALAPDGRMIGGWPYRLPRGWYVNAITADDNGTVTLAVAGEGCGEGLDRTTILLAADGTLLGEPPGTSLEQLYAALRPRNLRLESGGTAIEAGARATVLFDLVNESGRAVTLPRLTGDDGAFYSVGTLQTWIRPLDPVSIDGCLPNAGRKDAWYATGGWRNDAAGQVVVRPGAPVPLLFDAGLGPELTACLPPGAYRFRVEYGRVFTEDWEDPIADATLDVTIIAPVAGTP